MKIWMIDLIYIDYLAANFNIFYFMIFKTLLRVILYIILVNWHKLFLTMSFLILFISLVVVVRFFSVHFLRCLTFQWGSLSFRVQNLHFIFRNYDVNEVTHLSYRRLRFFLIVQINFIVESLRSKICKRSMTIFRQDYVWIICE